MGTWTGLNDEPVGQLGLHAPLRVGSDASIRQALRLLKENRRGALLVCQGDLLAGILTERDVLAILAEGSDLDARVSEKMTVQPLTIHESDSVATAIRRMAKNGYRRLPVVDDAGSPVGVVDVEGIVHFLVGHFPEAVYNLPPTANPATREREGP
jgi:CBS domain-containing protein